MNVSSVSVWGRGEAVISFIAFDSSEKTLTSSEILHGSFPCQYHTPSWKKLALGRDRLKMIHDVSKWRQRNFQHVLLINKNKRFAAIQIKRAYKFDNFIIRANHRTQNGWDWWKAGIFRILTFLLKFTKFYSGSSFTKIFQLSFLILKHWNSKWQIPWWMNIEYVEPIFICITIDGKSTLQLCRM